MSERFEHTPGNGTIFQNDSKMTERSPDWSGTLRLDRDYKAGETIKLSLWDRGPTRKSVGIKQPRPAAAPLTDIPESRWTRR